MTKISDMTETEYAIHLDKSAKVLKGVGQEGISEELKEASRRIRKLIADNAQHK